MTACVEDLSPLNLDLARICHLLENKYGGDDDSGLTYICGDDPPTVLQLTPFMMKEWAISIVHIFIFKQFIIIDLFLLRHDGMSTLQQPPSTQTFDPAN